MVRFGNVAPARIYSSFVWNNYNGAFDRYLAEIGDNPKVDLVNDYFLRWNTKERKHADFIVIGPLDQPIAGARVIADIPYQSTFFRDQHVFVMQVDKGAQ